MLLQDKKDKEEEEEEEENRFSALLVNFLTLDDERSFLVPFSFFVRFVSFVHSFVPVSYSPPPPPPPLPPPPRFRLLYISNLDQ